jgi:hypothetical protein
MPVRSFLRTLPIATAIGAGCGPAAEPAASSSGGTTVALDHGGCPGEGDNPLGDHAVHEGDLMIDVDADPSILRALTEVTGHLELEGVPSGESDLSFLSCLREADFIDVRNDDIQTLVGLDRLESFRLLRVSGANIRSLEGLASLRNAGELQVFGSPAMTTLGLEGVETAGAINLGSCIQFQPAGGNLGLTDVTGLTSIQALGALRIEGNENLESLEGLRVLAENGATVGPVTFRHNRSLPTAAAQEMANLLGAAALTCGNQGDDLEWNEEDTSDPCYCGAVGP